VEFSKVVVNGDRQVTAPTYRLGCAQRPFQSARVDNIDSFSFETLSYLRGLLDPGLVKVQVRGPLAAPLKVPIGLRVPQ
jgi:hypothetical protein